MSEYEICLRMDANGVREARFQRTDGKPLDGEYSLQIEMDGNVVKSAAVAGNE